MTAEQTYRSVSPDVCGVKTSRLQRPMRTVSRPRCVYVRQMHAGPYMCLLELERISLFIHWLLHVNKHNSQNNSVPLELHF